MHSSAHDAAGSGVKPVAIHPRILRPASFPPFDVYVRKGDRSDLTLFHRANEPVYANTWEKLRKGGHDVIYARAEDEALCLDYFEQNLAAVLAEDGLPAGQSAEWVYRLTRRAMEALLREPESWHDYNRVRQLVDGIVLTVRRHPRIEWQMADCAPLNYSTPAHCVNVGILLASFAGRVLGVDEPALLAEIALGGVLHDLGKAMIPSEILGKPAALTRGEFAQIKQHPSYGVRIAQPYLRHASIAPFIIGQHHENSGGDGYPEGRSGANINTFARAARIADVFDALTSNRPYGAAMDPYRALNTMANEMRAQFDQSMLVKFIRHVGTQSEDESPAIVRAEPSAAAEGEATSAADETELVAVPLQTGDNLVATTVDVQGPGEPAVAGEPQNADSEDAAPAIAQEAKPPVERPVLLMPQPAIRLEEIENRAEVNSELQETGACPALDPLAALEQADRRDVVVEAAVQERLDAIRELSEQQAGDTAFMGGLLTALRNALTGPFRETLQADAGARLLPFTSGLPEVQIADLPAQAAPQADATAVRSLFPLIWQLDEWLDRFGSRAPSVPEAVRLRAETVACLRALRESLVAILSAHNVLIVEDTQRSEPAEVLPPQPGEPIRVRRVGFAHHDGTETKILEPARIVLYADLRKAG